MNIAKLYLQVVSRHESTDIVLKLNFQFISFS